MRRIWPLVAVVLAAACGDATSSDTPPGKSSGGPGDAPDAAPSAPDGSVGGDAGAAGRPLTFLTLNLHGYHPMGEKERFFEDRSGKLMAAPSSTFYFTREELDRGQRARLDALAADLKTRLPDVIALEEVGAGTPEVARDCTTFENDSLGDVLPANTALRLAARLKADGYSVKVGCRGNIGWNTDPSTFADQRIVRMNGSAREVVFDFGANPYPSGFIVEGFALLWRAPLRAIETKVLDLPYDAAGDTFKAELVALEVDASSWVLVVVIHGGHKVAHFEEAIAVREAVSDYVASSPRKSSLAGVVMLGDFNARLHRPNAHLVLDEPSSVPWEIAVKGQYSYEDPDDAPPFDALASDMRALNASSYKTFATLPDDQAAARIDAAIGRMRAWERRARGDRSAPYVMAEALWTAGQTGACKPPSTGHAGCDVEARIDHVFFGGRLALDEAHALYTNDDDHDLAGTFSDHPGISATLRIAYP